MNMAKMEELQSAIILLNDLNSDNPSIMKLIGQLEDEYAEQQSELFNEKIAIIQAACKWATHDAILEYVMEWTFDSAFSVEHFKATLMN